ncbi:GNAT family N-acetyltransferase [Streptomyces canus]|uniref:GNAT family N-acetyltransferase n=1 Tax=Streptomyces canus TaxID=58343 RepID=UPI003250006F
MSQLSIRLALPDDEEELARLERAERSPLHDVLPEQQPPYRPFFDERHLPDDCLVAEADRRILGYIRLGFPTGPEASAHVRQIQGFVVSARARGRGVGRTLIRAITEEARRRGARRLTLRVLGHNTPARGLYESEGFAVEGVLPEEFLLAGEYVDDVLMGRRL